MTSLIGPSNAGAQPRAPTVYMVDIGARVRVDVTDRFAQSPFSPFAQRVQGTVRAIAPDTLYLDLPNTVGTIAIPRIMIQAVATSLGKDSRRASALETGTIAAVIFALVLSSEPVQSERRFGSHWYAAAVGAGTGFGAGVLLATLRPYERWRSAWLPE